MSNPFTLLVDDQDPQINYLCPTIKQKVIATYSNNTWSSIRSESCKDGWFEYTFYGTGIRVGIPTMHPAQDVSVTLDNTPLAPLADGSFESSTLADGSAHTLRYAIGNVTLAPVFDYLTVTAGPLTPLNGRTLIVDDVDLVFTGNWSTAPPHAIDYDYSTKLYQDTARWSSTVGDTMDFEFTGTSVSVYGLAVNVTGARNLTATYTIDGVTQTRRVPRGTFDSLPMTELFHASDLAGGKHTLRVNLTDVAHPHAFGIDFVSYNASVSSITSLPGYDPSANAAPLPTSATSGVKVGKIVGTVVGSVALLVLLLAALFFWRRSRRSSTKHRATALNSNNSSYDDIAAEKREA